METKFTRKALFVSAGNEMYDERIENDEYGEGTLSIDTEEGTGVFICGDARVEIENCTAILIDDEKVLFSNDEGDWLFNIV